VQIGPRVVLIGTVIYVFYTADTFTAVIFLIWSIFVGLTNAVASGMIGLSIWELANGW
jgi:multisubunit Na+/H+ antiporter MnhG subunit